MKQFTTQNFEETQVLGQNFAHEILAEKPGTTAVVLGLRGDLGSGKTTFLQGFAQGLGIAEKILSPTFIVMKRFPVTRSGFKNFYHIDCYRLGDEKDAEVLELKEIISGPENIVAIEWPEKIFGMLPENTILITFKHLEGGKRELTIQTKDDSL